MDELKTFIAIIGTGSPAISALALWFAWTKDREMTKLAERVAVMAEKNAVANERVASLLETLRELARPNR